MWLPQQARQLYAFVWMCDFIQGVFAVTRLAIRHMSAEAMQGSVYIGVLCGSTSLCCADDSLSRNKRLGVRILVVLYI